MTAKDPRSLRSKDVNVRGRTKTILVAAGLSLLLLLFVAVLVIRRDVPPNDSDMLLTDPHIPADRNAFTHFSAIEWKGSDEDDWKLIAIVKDEEPLTEEYVQSLCEKNREAFEHVARGLECPSIQVLPIPRSLQTEMPYLREWRQIATLMKLRAEMLSKLDRDKEAIEQAFQIIRFGHKVRAGRGGLIVYLVGASITNLGTTALQESISHVRLPPAELKPYIALLDHYRPDAAALGDSFRSDYMSAACEIDNRGARLFLRPGKTKRMLADLYRYNIALCEEAHATNLAAARSKVVYEPPFQKGTSYARLFATGNFAGIELFYILSPSESIVSLSCKMASTIASTKLLIALKCYHASTGSLPSSLDALVPEYIDSVPLDIFDGQPLRYSPEKKVIYSVGDNLMDDGGHKVLDVVIEIKFDEQAAQGQ